MRLTKRQIGQVLVDLVDDMRADVMRLVEDYRNADNPNSEQVLRQAVGTPHRARASLVEKIAQVDAEYGAGSATTFINEALALVGSSETAASLNATLNTWVTQADAIIAQSPVPYGDGTFTWEQIATWLEANVAPAVVHDFSYRDLPLPPGYIDAWGEPY